MELNKWLDGYELKRPFNVMPPPLFVWNVSPIIRICGGFFIAVIFK
jgi:hypothetical protein